MATKAAFENGVLGKSTIFALRFDMYPCHLWEVCTSVSKPRFINTEVRGRGIERACVYVVKVGKARSQTRCWVVCFEIILAFGRGKKLLGSVLFLEVDRLIVVLLERDCPSWQCLAWK